ncbi:MAG: nuclear transport factor 2 family protein [Elusimicrobia bacterium]|nr:nuclear transport factor 2 family protein [Elusimicrobiota bacterium]
MNAPSILATLRSLETELHRESTRRNPGRMKQLLHPGFEEFGRSGRRFTLKDIMAESAAPNSRLPKVVARGFKLTRISTDSALLTYISAHEDASGRRYRHTLRSSLWLRTTDGWRMRFHQGTPMEGRSRNRS